MTAEPWTGPGAITAAMYTVAGGKSARAYIFFGVGPPALLMNRGPSLKLDRSQAVGYYKIMKGINYVN